MDKAESTEGIVETVPSGEKFAKAICGDTKPETVEEALKRWDSGGTLWTVERGGIGPGYEQAIQVGAIELCRVLVGKELPEDDEPLNQMFDQGLHEVCKEFDLGLSGAQAEAIQQLACRYLRDGWKNTVDSVPFDSRIMISNVWPGQRKSVLPAKKST